MDDFPRNMHLLYWTWRHRVFFFSFLFPIFFCNSLSIHGTFQLLIYVSAHKHAYKKLRGQLPPYTPLWLRPCLWSWRLKGIWNQLTSFPTNLYLKGCQLCPIFFVFLERESMSQPYYVFVGLSSSLIMPPSVQFGFLLGMKLCERRFGYLCRTWATSRRSSTHKI